MSGAIKSHEDLTVWKQAIELADLAYDLCEKLPDSERYGLVSQLQRASVSVPANIAEGCGRDSTKDLLRHLSIAQGSLAEVRTFLVIIRRRKFVSADQLNSVESKSVSVARLLVGFQKSLRGKLEAK